MIETQADDDQTMAHGSFADYLTAHLIAHKNATEDLPVPELEPLRAACDRLLVRADGMTFMVWCIVDCTEEPADQFAVDAETVRAISKACLKYSGRIGLARMPAGITVIEVRDRAPSEDDIQRLSQYRRTAMFSKAMVSAVSLDTGNRQCWLNGPIGQRLGARRWYRKLLEEPRRPASVDHGGRRLTEAATARPWVSFVLAALFVAIYVAEVRFAVSADDRWVSIGTRTLAALGAINPALILDHGEWYRLLIGPLLHGGVLHLGFNLFALMLAGFAAERLLGHAWFGAIFFIGALAGGVTSMWLGSPGMVAVGASGGLMALLAAGVVCSFRMVDNAERLQIQMPLMFVLVPSLIPLVTVDNIGGVTDYAAHFGGAVAGVLVAIVLRRTWRGYAKQPSGQRWATVIVAVTVLTLAGANHAMVSSYPAYAQVAHYIPDDEFPDDWSQMRSRIAGLAEAYPQDPRAHYYQGRVLLEDERYAQATAAFRQARQNYQAHSSDFSADFDTEIRLFLTLSLAAQNKMAMARREAGAVCQLPAESEERSLLEKYDLCE